MSKRMHSDSPVSDQVAPAADELDDETGDVCSPALSLATRLRAESDARRKRLRGKPGPRANPSIWTTLAIGAKDASNKAPCAACASMISVSRGSSSNVVAHYRRWHAAIAAEVADAPDNDAKRQIFIKLRPAPKKKGARTASPVVPAAMNAATRREMHLTPPAIPRLNEAVKADSDDDGMESSADEGSSHSLETSLRPVSKVHRPTSMHMRRLISGLILAAVHQLPIWSLAGPELEAFLHFTGTPVAGIKEVEYHKIMPDVHSAVTRICAREAGKSFKLRAHESLSSIVDESILGLEEDYLRMFLGKINEISNFIESYPHIGAKLLEEQLKVFAKDRIITMAVMSNPGWQSLLTLLENYITLKPILRKVLPTHAPELFNESDEMCLAESIVVLREVRRVMRALEAEGRGAGSRTPRLLKELCDTLDLFATDKDSHAEVLSGITQPRESTAEDDLALIASRRTALRDPDAQILAENLNDNIQAKLNFVFMPVGNAYAEEDMVDVGETVAKKTRASKGAVALHCAAVFDINECGFDWMTDGLGKTSYVKLLIDMIVQQLPGIMGDAFDEVVDYKSNLLSLHRTMKEHLDILGRKEPAEAAEWWRAIEKSSVADVLKQRLHVAPMFVVVARKFLAIPDASSTKKRRITDGTQEDLLGKLRSFVDSRTREVVPDKRSEAVNSVAEEIRLEIEKEQQL